MTESNATPEAPEVAPEAEPVEAPKSVEELLAEAKAAGAVVDMTPSEFADAAESLRADYATAVRTERTALDAKKRAAWRDVTIRSHVTFEGHVDWAAQSPAYLDVVVPIRDLAFKDVRRDVRQRTEAAIRQLVARTFRPLAICYFVLSRADASLIGEDGIPDVPAPEDVVRLDGQAAFQIVTGSDTLKAAAAAEFRAAGLTVPPEFGGEQRGRGETGGPESGEPENPLADAADAFQLSRERGTFLGRAEGLLKWSSDFSEDILGKSVGSIPEREKVLSVTERTVTVLTETLRLLRGKAEDADASLALVAANKWNASDEDA